MKIFWNIELEKKKRIENEGKMNRFLGSVMD